MPAGSVPVSKPGLVLLEVDRLVAVVVEVLELGVRLGRVNW